MVDKRLTGWTDERIDRLAKLWKEGATASEIAAELGGVTRNAVCGKIDRLGLSGQRRADKMRAARKAPTLETDSKPPSVQPQDRLKVGVGAQVTAIRRLKKADGPTIINEDFKARVADVISRRVTILEVLAMECRWADKDRNDDGLHTFCGNPTGDGASYCPAHAALAVGPGTASERKASSIREAA